MQKIKRVSLTVDSDDLNPEDKYKVVFVNGKRHQIRKDEEVEVFPIVKEIIKESNALHKKGNKKEKLILD
jgi:hypothetical protein